MGTKGKRKKAVSSRPHHEVERLESRYLLATLPTGFLETRIAQGLDSVTAMTLAPDGRIFVSEQGGAVRIIKDGTLLAEPFAVVPVTFLGELGLQSVVLDPQFESNHYVYVFYVAPGMTPRIDRFVADGDTAEPGSQTLLIQFEQLASQYHVGGAMKFLPDGTLLIARGDNFSYGVAQVLNSFQGKLLRLNADGSIPTDNPFYDMAAGDFRAIWALGLRNPYTIAIQPGTGRIFVNDVGQDSWEEVNQAMPGANYGWPATEGDFDPVAYPDFTRPVYTYAHPPERAAITGGTFYNPVDPTFGTEFVGSYFFSDYVGGWIRRLDLTGPSPQVTEFATGIQTPLYPTVADDGSLYYLERGTGSVWRIQSSTVLLPQIANPPQNLAVSIDQPASFEVVASGESLTFQWQRDGADIPGATASSFVLSSPSLLDNQAVFRCIVTNVYGSVASSDATLTVLNNHLPMPEIIEPAVGATYTGAAVIEFSGIATDQEDGVIGPAMFSWRVDFHHHTHVHPFIPEIPGLDGGAFVIPIDNEPDPDVWYRIYFTVTDSAGASQTVYRDILPVIAHLTVTTSPPGLTFLLDGQPRVAPFEFDGVVGIQRSLEAPLTQMVGDQQYDFVGWSNDRPASHLFVIGSTDDLITASYHDVTPPTIEDWSFEWNNRATPHAIRVRFSENVSASLDASDLHIVNQATSAVIVPESWSYDPVSRIAEFRLASLLPDGSYVASFEDGAVVDSGDNPIAPAPGFEFFFNQADANRDGRVDLYDLVQVAINFRGSDKLFSEGDFNYDGVVDASDLAILAVRWGQVPVSPLTSFSLPTLPTSSARSPTRPPTRVSSVLQILDLPGS